MKPDHVRNEIARTRLQVRAQEREIELLRRAGAGTAAAELLLTRMRAKLEDLSKESEHPRTPPG